MSLQRRRSVSVLRILVQIFVRTPLSSFSIN